jgi:internalin A
MDDRLPFPRGTTMTKMLPLLAVLLVAGPSLNADEAEDKAVAFVKKLGGVVHRDDKDPAHPVIEVVLDDPNVTDTDLKELASLKGLNDLILHNTKVTDAGLKEVTAFKGLTFLALGGTQVTDAGLKEVARLENLKYLILGQGCSLLGPPIPVTDAGLKHLNCMQSLRVLDLSGLKVTDAGLKHLSDLKGLQHLNLFDTGVTDAGVAELQKALPKCKIRH